MVRPGKNGNLLPSGNQWQPGKSGNPGGRPKGGSITSILRELLSREVRKGFPKPKTHAHEIAQKLVTLAIAGDIKAIRIVLDRVEGRVPERVELSGEVNTLSIVANIMAARERRDNMLERDQRETPEWRANWGSRQSDPADDTTGTDATD